MERLDFRWDMGFVDAKECEEKVRGDEDDDYGLALESEECTKIKKATFRLQKVAPAEATGFEPAISALTGLHVRPLHHASAQYLHFNHISPLVKSGYPNEDARLARCAHGVAVAVNDSHIPFHSA